MQQKVCTVGGKDTGYKLYMACIRPNKKINTSFVAPYCEFRMTYLRHSHSLVVRVNNPL